MVARRLYEIIGLICGFVLIDYGFNFLATGFPGARPSTSQSVGVSLLLTGSAAVFISLYYLLKPASVYVQPELKLGTGTPDVGVELISDEKDTGSHYGLYRNLEFIGYFFTALGIFSAADLTLQVFIPSIYNEIRWWVEILLVTFGVLSYAIFFSIGRLGLQEEPRILKEVPRKTAPEVAAAPEAPKAAPAMYSDILEVRLSAFSETEAGEYEQHLSGNVYDLVRADPAGVTIWREDRLGLRSVYLAGPYELGWSRVQEALNRGEELRIGNLLLPLQTMRDLLDVRGRTGEGISSQAAG